MNLVAFHETFEQNAAPAPLGLKALLRELNRPQPVPPERLEAMRQKVLEAARETARDLQDFAPCEELAALMQAMVEDYQLISALLRQLAQEGPSPQLVAELQAADDQLADSDAAMEEWERRAELRCPACGEPAPGPDWLCPGHGVGPLYPDPDHQPSARQVELGDLYLETFQLYQEALDGTAHLDCLWDSVTELEAMLRRFQVLARSEDGHGETTTQALARVEQASARSLAGLQRMRSCERTRRTSDLNAGWALVFEQAVEIQACVPLIARAFGVREVAGAARPQDNLDIDFD